MKRTLLTGLAAMAIVANSQAITIKVDYTYDSSGFFATDDQSNPDGALAHATVEQAAKDLGDALTQQANATFNTVGTSHFISGNGLATVDWTFSFRNPSLPPPADPADTSGNITITDFSPYTADTFTVYAGASTLTGSNELGEGAPLSISRDLEYGGAGDESQNVAGIQDVVALSNGYLSRGSGPTEFVDTSDAVVGSTPVHIVLKVGSVAGFLSLTSGAKWHLDYHTLPAAGEYDLYSVALHEMMHALGFGSSETWDSLRAANNQDWEGSHVSALRLLGGVNVLDGDTESAHINPSEVSTTLVTTAGVAAGTPQTPVMSPSLPSGIRRTLTQLDLAFLLDLGFGPASALPVASTTPLPTPTPTPAPTATPTPTVVPVAPPVPVLAVKPPKSTTVSKVTLSGSLVTSGSAYVVFKVGKGTFVKAKGSNASWKAVIKLKPGVNIVYVASFDPVSGLTSGLKKITIKRH